MGTMINIAEVYTKFPGGRYPQDGKGNGTDFRERFLVPVLKAHGKALIVLDGAVGYPSSFLDEAFGGLVRSRGFSADQVLSAFEFKAEKPGFSRFVSLIKEYVRAAKPEPVEDQAQT